MPWFASSRPSVTPKKKRWERGALYEREVITGLETPFLDLSPYAGDEKERLTLEPTPSVTWRLMCSSWLPAALWSFDGFTGSSQPL